MTKIISFIMAAALMLILTACPTPTNIISNKASQTDNTFTSFGSTIPDSSTEIIGNGITLTVPFGTSKAAIVPTFSTAGKSVTVLNVPQISGTTVKNFTNPLYYKITSLSGLERVYLVSVVIAPFIAPAKDITAFSFTSPAVTGVIIGTDITINLAYGTDISALVANFTITGASVQISAVAQVSGTTANDFTNALIYRVTASDASTKDYTVTVILPEEVGENSAFGTATTPGDQATITISGTSSTLNMQYANDQTSINFPTGSDDSGTATLTSKFWMGETEVTNKVFTEVLQWAYDNGKFSSVPSSHNELNQDYVRYGSRSLLNMISTQCKINYDGAGTFSVDPGYENKPVTKVSWFGAIMFCNALTEMRDGNTDNVVYSNINTTWLSQATTEDVNKNGYRIPSANEWEYAARYRGNDSTNTVSGYSSPYFTKGNSASGATDAAVNVSATNAVAVNLNSSPVPTDEADVKSLGPSSANALGLYDMSGNVFEWGTVTVAATNSYRGGAYISNSTNLGIYNSLDQNPVNTTNHLGFRIARTAD